ncbi:unnamed protein product, partial [Soboliphyme baturini]|uniref:Kelch-like protein 10 n=1 Tax=Soboliphyme baturini TaxID=241478 RepID=A0A183IVJ9_9BILA
MWWTAYVDGGPRRVNHAAVAVGDFIYSFGGYCSGADYERPVPIDVHVFNTSKQFFVLLFIHFYSSSSFVFFKRTCIVFSILDTYQWHSLPAPKHILSRTIPYQRYGHTAVGYRNNCYIWGGRNDVDGACNVLFEFDPRSAEWSKIHATGVVPPARDGHSACVYGDKMLVFGGYEEIFQRFSNETYIFDFPSPCRTT